MTDCGCRFDFTGLIHHCPRHSEANVARLEESVSRLLANLAEPEPDGTALLCRLRDSVVARECNPLYTAEYRQCAGHIVATIDRILAAANPDRIEAEDPSPSELRAALARLVNAVGKTEHLTSVMAMDEYYSALDAAKELLR